MNSRKIDVNYDETEQSLLITCPPRNDTKVGTQYGVPAL